MVLQKSRIQLSDWTTTEAIGENLKFYILQEFPLKKKPISHEFPPANTGKAFNIAVRVDCVGLYSMGFYFLEQI